ncbi:MAG TPA: DHA2 family efflux MFS transporter permease subunit [Gammaproteobacteria bacterium]|jgi:DHA2 family multidrug resistance protein|nr:DHA2 family efflux MFS transporter permease subunit [Gammaproteobacteria bacterium]
MLKLYQQISTLERWLITIALMSATLMQVLDMTIVNVALPHMQGSLSAAPNEITWILTSYLVASAIFMPLTGYFTDILGQKKFLLISIIGFVIASMLCGIATSMIQIVVFRLLQGIFGAALVPLSQTILTDIYPPEDQGTAMAIWGVGVMIGPILGPTLGGYLTEVANWRWNFYINIPVGIIALIIIWFILKETEKKPRQMDWFGLISISVGIGAMQYTLDRGNGADWFNSWEICISTVCMVAGFMGFILSNFYQKQRSVFNIKIFADRNFFVSSVIIVIFGLGLFGTTAILPLMLENLFQYPVLTTGLIISPRGVSTMISMVMVGKLIKHVDPRKLIFIGMIFCVLGIYPGTYYNLNIDAWWIIWPLLLQGFGLGLIFIPLSSVAYSTLKDSMRTEAAGLFSLLRTIGSSIAISIIITLYTRHTQSAWNQLGGFIHPYNPAVHDYLRHLQLTLDSPLSSTILASELSKQAQMIAFVDIYAFITFSFLLMIPMVFLLKKKLSTPMLSHPLPVTSKA